MRMRPSSFTLSYFYQTRDPTCILYKHKQNLCGTGVSLSNAILGSDKTSLHALKGGNRVSSPCGTPRRMRVRPSSFTLSCFRHTRDPTCILYKHDKLCVVLVFLFQVVSFTRRLVPVEQFATFLVMFLAYLASCHHHCCDPGVFLAADQFHPAVALCLVEHLAKVTFRR